MSSIDGRTEIFDFEEGENPNNVTINSMAGYLSRHLHSKNHDN